MKDRFVLLLILLLLTIGQNAHASCAVDITIEDSQRLYQRGLELEKSGSYWLALRAYVEAQRYSCDNQNHLTGLRAAEKAAALAKRAVVDPLREKRWFDSTEIQPGVFQWHELGGHFNLADDALISALKQSSQNMELVNFALLHFSARNLATFASNRQLAIRAAGPYQLNPENYRFVTQLPKKNVSLWISKVSAHITDEYLGARQALESQQFKPGINVQQALQIQQQHSQFQQQWGGDRLAQALADLDKASDWQRLEPDARQATELQQQIDVTRTNLANRIMRFADAPSLLETAKDIYLRANESRLVNKSKVVAKSKGDAAMEVEQFAKAAEFYRIADMFAEENLARAAMENSTAQQIESQMGMHEFGQWQSAIPDPVEIKRLQEMALELQRQFSKQSNEALELDNNSDENLADELGL
jgi:hypothetical protein